METKVINLATGQEVSYSLPARRAVVAAWYQFEKKDFNTWGYDYENAPVVDGERTVACGDWCAMKEEDKNAGIDHFFTQAPVNKGHYHAMCIVAGHNTFAAADRLLHRPAEATQDDVEVATANGLVTMEIDIEGYYPSPTWLYIALQEYMYGVVEDD